MKITTINDEATLDELIDRVQGAGAAKKKGVRDEFLELNPHLADFEKLPAGTPVILPADSAAAPAPDPRVQIALEQTQQAMTLIRDDLDAGTERAAVNGRNVAAVLNDPRLTEAAKTNPDIKKSRTQVFQSLNDQDKNWNDQRDAITSALNDFEATLKNWTPPDGGGDPIFPPVGRRRAVGK